MTDERDPADELGPGEDRVGQAPPPEDAVRDEARQRPRDQERQGRGRRVERRVRHAEVIDVTEAGHDPEDEVVRRRVEEEEGEERRPGVRVPQHAPSPVTTTAQPGAEPGPPAPRRAGGRAPARDNATAPASVTIATAPSAPRQPTPSASQATGAVPTSPPRTPTEAVVADRVAKYGAGNHAASDLERADEHDGRASAHEEPAR